MAKSALSAGVALALCVGGALAQDAQPLTAFGIPLKRPLVVPACVPDVLGVRAPQGGECGWQKEGLDFSKPDFSGEVVVHFWVARLPWYVSGNQVRVEIVGGSVERISFSTGGVPQQDTVNRDLTAKFGEPSKSLPRKVRNGYGATFDTGIWMWSLGDVSVSHWGSFARINDGRVFIGTNAGDEAASKREQLDAERLKPKVPL